MDAKEKVKMFNTGMSVVMLVTANSQRKIYCKLCHLLG